MAALVVGAGPRGARVAGRLARLREQRGEGVDAIAVTSDSRALSEAAPAATHRLGQGDTPESAMQSLERVSEMLEQTYLWSDAAAPLVVVVDAGERDGIAVAADALARRNAIATGARSAAIVCKPCGFEKRGHAPSLCADGVLGTSASLLALADMDLLLANDATLTAEQARHLAEGTLATATVAATALLAPTVSATQLEQHSTAASTVCRPGWSDTGAGGQPSVREALHGPFTPRNCRIATVASAVGGASLGQPIQHASHQEVADLPAAADADTLSVGAGDMLAPSEAVTFAGVTNERIPERNFDGASNGASKQGLQQHQRAQMSKIAGGTQKMSHALKANGHSTSSHVAERIAQGDTVPHEEEHVQQPGSSDVSAERQEAAAASAANANAQADEQPQSFIARLGLGRNVSNNGDDQPLNDDTEREQELERDALFGKAGNKQRRDEQSNSGWERAMRVIAEDRKLQSGRGRHR